MGPSEMGAMGEERREYLLINHTAVLMGFADVCEFLVYSFNCSKYLFCSTGSHWPTSHSWREIKKRWGSMSSVHGNFDMESPRWWVVPETDDRVDCSLRSRAAESSISMEKIWYHTKHRFNMPIWRVLCQFLDSTTDGLVSAWLSGDPLNHDPCGYTFRTLRGRSRRTWRCLWLRHRSLRTDAGRGRGS